MTAIVCIQVHENFTYEKSTQLTSDVYEIMRKKKKIRVHLNKKI